MLMKDCCNNNSPFTKIDAHQHDMIPTRIISKYLPNNLIHEHWRKKPSQLLFEPPTVESKLQQPN